MRKVIVTTTMMRTAVRVEPVIGRHLDRLRLLNRRPSSIRHRLEALTRLTLWANGPILYLTEEQLAQWQQDRSRDVSSQTLRVETSHVREFYRWALAEKLIDAVAAHAEQNENPTEAERALYKALEGTRHETKIHH
jgi:site-specific recombinase XerD